MKKSDYTIEYCPWCELEQVIYSKGVTACPDCGKPLMPCSVCDGCDIRNCPYGRGDTADEELIPIDRHITQREIDYFLSESKKPTPIKK